MAVWEADPHPGAQSDLMADFANVWQTADKIVYSTTLHAESIANTAAPNIARRAGRPAK